MFNSQVWYKYHESNNTIDRRINAIVNTTSFWKDARKVVNNTKPILKVLCLIDGDKKLTMDFLYKAMRLMKDAINDATPRS